MIHCYYRRVAFAMLVGAMIICSLTQAEGFVQPPSATRHSMLPQPAKHDKFLPKPSVQPSTLQIRGGAPRLISRKPLFDGGPFWQYNGAIVFTNLVGFVISLFTASQMHLDLVGTGAFALAALSLLRSDGKQPQRLKLSGIAVATWGIKLAGFLYYRVAMKGEDSRLEGMLSTLGGTATFWFLSCLWGIVCSLPYSLGAMTSAPGNNFALTIGFAMYVAGLAIESIADFQKWTFKETNPGKFCSIGLWSISQHPNFLGNLLLWAGIFVMNAPALVEPIPLRTPTTLWTQIKSYRRVFYALLSPWFMWTLFDGQAKGAMSNTVDLATSKYGADPRYRQYTETVPLIIPKLFRFD